MAKTTSQKDYRRTINQRYWEVLLMYLSHILVENFRIFGSRQDNNHLDLSLTPGLTVLVGENDSGKSAVIDAIRAVLGMTSHEYTWLTEDDFNVTNNSRSDSLLIQCRFDGLTSEEQGRFLEWLSLENGQPCLFITLRAQCHNSSSAVAGRRNRISRSVHSGQEGDGPSIEGEAREYLRVTYLKPLRDAVAEMSSGRGSRLSQILQAHPKFQEQSDAEKPGTLVNIMRGAEQSIAENPVIADAKEDINTDYLEELSLKDDHLEGHIGVAQHTELRQILEKLELYYAPDLAKGLRTPRGLGLSNILFMSAELLLLKRDATFGLPLLMIEEPEAHLHPQLQVRLMEFLDEKANPEGSPPVQILVTTHSPNLASKIDPDRLVLLKDGKTYPLAKGQTKLEPGDYRFLKRFLDMTKANLFFAKGVIIVEGDAESLLLPVLAKKLERPLDEYGVSIVNVGHTGLFRYARIFQRQQGRPPAIPIACIMDRDIVPDAAEYIEETSRTKKMSSLGKDKLRERFKSRHKSDGQYVKSFVSPEWTLEHDLARNLNMVGFLYQAVSLSVLAKSKNELLTEKEKTSTRDSAIKQLEKWRNESKSKREIAALVYQPLKTGSASKAVCAQFLAELLEEVNQPPPFWEKAIRKYLVDAIEYVTEPLDREENSHAS